MLLVTPSLPSSARDLVSALHLDTLTGSLGVLTSMITPALLISATGTFILSTSNRIGRVVDRVRQISDKLEDLVKDPSQGPGFEEYRVELMSQMDKLSIRADLLARSLTVLYLASGTFILTSVTIGVVAITPVPMKWLPLLTGMVGASMLFYGCILLIREARMALNVLHSEMTFLVKVVRSKYKSVPAAD